MKRHIPCPSTNRSPDRRGSILVLVLIALLVASMLGFGLLKTVMIDRRQMVVASGQQQSFLLAEAGVQRALHRLAGDHEYEGETWDVPAEVLGSSRSAVVTIEVVEADDGEQEPTIHVHVNLDDGRIQPVECRQEYRLSLGGAEK